MISRSNEQWNDATSHRRSWHNQTRKKRKKGVCGCGPSQAGQLENGSSIRTNQTPRKAHKVQARDRAKAQATAIVVPGEWILRGTKDKTQVSVTIGLSLCETLLNQCQTSSLTREGAGFGGTCDTKNSTKDIASGEVILEMSIIIEAYGYGPSLFSGIRNVAS